MIDVVDDLGPFDARELALRDVFACDLVAFEELAGFIFAAALVHFLLDGLLDLAGFAFSASRNSWLRKPMWIVDLDHAAFGGERFDHVVGHVARRVAEGAAGGVRGDHGRFADGQHVGESFVGDVRDVDHHAQAVHFADDFLAESR